MSFTNRASHVDDGQQNASRPDDCNATAGDALHKRAQSRRVLVVDDNHDASASLAILLRLLGHAVVVAEDGHATLCLVEAGHSFDVALLDIGLPGMSGHELARSLRHRFPQPVLRLVALTGHGLPPTTISGPGSGFDDYFVKPVNFEALLVSIGKAGRPRD